jgi:hypothetical protein
VLLGLCRPKEVGEELRGERFLPILVVLDAGAGAQVEIRFGP